MARRGDWSLPQQRAQPLPEALAAPENERHHRGRQRVLLLVHALSIQPARRAGRHAQVHQPETRSAGQKAGPGRSAGVLEKPRIRPKWLSLSAYDQMPESMPVRIIKVVADPGAGYRTTELHLASTVLDPTEVSTAEMGEIYLSRWQVERKRSIFGHFATEHK